jgi:phage terminase large subunit
VGPERLRLCALTPAQLKIREWRENPCRFVYEEFGVTPDKWQQDALNVFPSQEPDKLRIALQACVGPGKSALLAWCGWNFLSCYGEEGNHPKGAAVAVTSDNLRDNLWPEFAKWQSRSEFMKRAFKWTKERIFAVDHSETWFMSARSYAKDADAEQQGKTLSGLHSKYTLCLLDESGEIPPAVAKAAEQTLSTGDRVFGKIIQAGNPSSLTGILHAASTVLRHLWYVIRITGDPDDPKRSPRIDLDWAREQIRTYGRDNPWVMYSILGLFPPSSINALLGPDEVATAMERHLREDAYHMSQKRLGIDVARFGDDRTIIFPRQGLVSFRFAEMRNARTNEIAARVARAKADWGSEMEFVDGSGGYGAGVIDSLMQAGHTPQEVNFSGKSIDPRYFNKRSEMWFEMANWVKRGGVLPPDPTLLKELTAPTYTFQSGKLRLEEKEQIKKRLGFSPDCADALALTFSLPDMPAAVVDGVRLPVSSGKLLADYDPFASV